MLTLKISGTTEREKPPTPKITKHNETTND